MGGSDIGIGVKKKRNWVEQLEVVIRKEEDRTYGTEEERGCLGSNKILNYNTAGEGTSGKETGLDVGQRAQGSYVHSSVRSRTQGHGLE